MRRIIQKSENVTNQEVAPWKELLEEAGFPKQHMNLGAEYCDFHTKKECAAQIHGSPEDHSLLPLAIFILKELNLDEVKEYALVDECESRQRGMKILAEEVDAMRHGHVAVEAIVDHVQNGVRKEIVDEINDAIAKSENKVLNIGILVSSIQMIAEVAKPGEKPFPPVISMKYNYSVE